jgi:hypothetical protein
LKPISKYKELKLPFWKSDKGDYLLTVKDKHVRAGEELTRDVRYVASITFASYELVDKDIKGFFAKIDKLFASKEEDNEEVSNESSSD